MTTIRSAICYARTIEQSALEQIELIEQSPIGGASAHIRIMPDAHSGKGCVIGTTMHVNDRVIPSVVGVDIGCGVVAYHLNKRLTDSDLRALDTFCSRNIVAGQRVRETALAENGSRFVDALYCVDFLRSRDYLARSLGTLGGGNHFIEIDRANDGSCWLMIHTGSRHLGLEVAQYYQSLCGERGYLDGELYQAYIHDIDFCQRWAKMSRQAIAQQILDGMGWYYTDIIESIHNYIDVENMILRKGAISAQHGEMCVIPLNMRDGVLICRGKGNADWNYSAPHGAGRLLSRGQAKRSVSLTDYQISMSGIVSSTVCLETIDESPFAYKDYREIMDIVQDTVDIIERIIPVFSFKGIS